MTAAGDCSKSQAQAAETATLHPTEVEPSAEGSDDADISLASSELAAENGECNTVEVVLTTLYQPRNEISVRARQCIQLQVFECAHARAD